MDAAGRLVLPRAIRDEARLEPGMPLRVVCRDGRIEIEPAEREVRLVRKGGILVAVPVEATEPLRNDTVRATTASLRNRQR
jgi:AbrB family looped-hinge helix DNA binding protein